MSVLRWIIAVALVLSSWLVLVVPALGFIVSCYPEPVLPVLPSLSQKADALHCGNSWRMRIGDQDDGVWLLHLKGDAIDRGMAHGLLMGEHLHTLENEMMETFTTLVPTWLGRHLILGWVSLNNRRLPEYFHDDELIEIAATSHALQDQGLTAANQPHYPRAVQYHALHDISHTLIDNPLVRMPQIGCTAIALGPSRTADSRLLVGRVFDFEGGVAFDRDKVVHSIHPATGLRHLSVAWPGAAGAVTGLNEAGLWVSLNAADTDQRGRVGRPIIMAAREILASCRTLAEAEAILRQTEVFVAETILLASGDEGRAIAVELGPQRCEIRAMDDDLLVATNHFLAPAWHDDLVNAERMQTGTSTLRMQRAMQLVGSRRNLQPADLLTVLRDRRGLDGSDLGFGNRGTINAWIGAHLVIADPARRRIWVCGPWHGLGRAHAIGFAGAMPDDDLPADAERERHDRDAGRWQQLLRTAETLLAAGRPGDAAPIARQAAELNPRHWQSLLILARCERDPDARLALARQALAAQPPYPEDRALVNALIPQGLTP